MLRLLTRFAVAGAALPAAQAILVAPKSPCSSNCGNVLDSTSSADIVCIESQYNDGYNSGAGQIFQGCLKCELSSPFATGNNYTDSDAMLYNLRYALSYCLFDFPKNKEVINTPCITSKACGPFRDAIVSGNLSTKADGYDYCNLWPVTDQLDFLGCTQCLQAGENFFLANFVTVLQAGCEQKPLPGTTIAFDGEVFTNQHVNVSAPTPIAKVDPDWFDNGPINLGAKVGIAVGGFIFLLIIAGIAIVWNGKRRRRAYLKTLEIKYTTNKGWPSPQSPLDHGETPLSQRPLRGWDDLPMTINTEKGFPKYFSPYSSQYNSPVSAQEVRQMPWPDAALSSPREIGIALGETGGAGAAVADSSHDLWQPPMSPHDDKCKIRDESYEMHEVDSAGSGNSRGKERAVHIEAPVLSHPGYGRNPESPPRQYNLVKNDPRDTNAF